MSLINLGIMALNQGDYTVAWALFEEGLALFREMGDKWDSAGSLCYLGLVASIQGDYTAARVLQEESLALFKEMDDKSDMAYCLLSLGLIDLAENKPEARENILGSLRLRVETGEQLYQTSSLIGAAGLVLGDGNPQFAAGLLGAVESASKVLNAVVETEIKFFHERTLAQVKEALGEDAFRSAWEEGSRWSLEEAVKRALDQSGG